MMYWTVYRLHKKTIMETCCNVRVAKRPFYALNSTIPPVCPIDKVPLSSYRSPCHAVESGGFLEERNHFHLNSTSYAVFHVRLMLGLREILAAAVFVLFFWELEKIMGHARENYSSATATSALWKPLYLIYSFPMEIELRSSYGVQG